MKHIETVKDLITALLDYNQDAKVCIGNNFNNRVALGWSGGEGCKKKDCQYLCLDMADGGDFEQETKVEEPKFEDTAKTSSLKAIPRGVRNGRFAAFAYRGDAAVGPRHDNRSRRLRGALSRPPAPRAS